MSSDDKFIRLPDGRALAYSEYGDPDGSPVFFFHGNPGSRLVRLSTEDFVADLGVRIITPERPGFGVSDFQPKRTLLDYPQDIARLADALGLDRFPIFGVSAGGSYVAVCAYALEQRITRAAIVSGPAPFDREGPYEGMTPAWERAFKMCKLPEWLLRAPIALQAYAQKRNPDKGLDTMAAMFSRADADKLINDAAIRARFKRNVLEASRRGARGWTREAKIQTSPWGFRPEDIRIPVDLWYWEDDPAIPPQMGRYLERAIPTATSRFLPGGGHLSIIDYLDKIIEGLLNEQASASRQD
uniref:Pimeloyl-ACP methyl ester carboxylesterase n=1 Tax=Candidatus Kentrum sp. SD TaxID=2126332 RepID=A0A450YW73_9GAMM|nr:MAG: Pimeloyl-ACP methyl ester carboxylesterase [Candidatus Kentron sp. SD]VFK45782.1 MAG: Pimeloyl-ACP methyl ester carboxylesterase [Candidatus Kentron sp. SD]VFK79777.1 MAG: Pimeloyl-ACP methyl ester carboxylesterase [Candidatus Kentron sp. SD]